MTDTGTSVAFHDHGSQYISHDVPGYLYLYPVWAPIICIFHTFSCLCKLKFYRNPFAWVLQCERIGGWTLPYFGLPVWVEFHRPCKQTHVRNLPEFFSPSSYEVGPRNSKVGIRFPTGPYVKAIGWWPYWPSRMEASYCTFEFVRIIWHNMSTLSFCIIYCAITIMCVWFKSTWERQVTLVEGLR